MNNKYLTTKLIFDFKVISPLFAGGAKEKNLKEGFDFIRQNGKICHVSQKQIFSILRDKSAGDVEVFKEFTYKYLEYLETKDLAILTYLLGDDVFEKNSIFIGECNSEIKTFVRDGMGKVYVPGSSIKGAIRSAFLQRLVEGSDDAIDIKQDQDKKHIGAFEDGFMQFIRVGDVYFKASDPMEIANVHTYYLTQIDPNRIDNAKFTFKQNLQMTLEVLKPNVSGQLAVYLMNGLWGWLQKQNRLLKTGAIEYLFDLSKNKTLGNAFINNIDKSTVIHLEREFNFFNTFSDLDQNKGTTRKRKITSGIEDLLDYPVSPNQCRIRMGFGSGFHGITGDYQYSDHVIKLKEPYLRQAKTRKIIEYNNEYLPMGVALLTLKEQSNEI